MNQPNRFARFSADGRLVALVADGPVPEWPADLAAVEDAQLRVLEEAYLAEFTRLEADPNADLTELRALAEHVAALRAAAAERMSSTEPEVDPANEPEPTPPIEGDPAPAPAEPEPTPAPAAEPTAEEARAAALAAMRDLMDPPAPPPPTIIQQVGMDAEAVTAAITAAAEAGARAAAQALTPVIERMTPRPAEPEPITAAGLAAFRPARLAPTDDGEGGPRRLRKLQASADVPGLPMGGEITDMPTLVKAFQRRHETLGVSSGVNDERIPVASLAVEPVPERDIRQLDWDQARAKVMSVMGPEAEGVDPWTGKPALIASGGISAPVEPFYEQAVFATGARPVLAALPSFTADRGGIRLVRPPSLGSISAVTTPGLFTDGVTNTDTSFTSATASFTAADVGQPITGNGIAAGTIISSVTNGTTVVLSTATTATATGVTFHLPSRNPTNLGAPVGIVTAAQDAAAFGTIKYTFDVPLGSQVEFDVYSVYTSLQFANLTARTFPEQVEAYIRLADALEARVAETALLDRISLWSELMNFKKTFGTARQLLAQVEHMAAYYRNVERMDPRAVLRLGMPAWVINAMRADYISSFIGGASEWGLSDDELAGWFRDRALMPFFYLDGPTDINQIFAAVGSGAIGNGTTLGTPVDFPDYPGSGSTTSFRSRVATFMWAEGTWLGLTTGELNLGLIRDSLTTAANRFRNFNELWEAPAMVGVRSLRCVHTIAQDGSFAAAASVTLGAGSGL